MIREQLRTVSSGYIMLLVLFLAQGLTIFGLVRGIIAARPPLIIASVVTILVVGILWFGFFLVHPNQAKVLQLFGKYVGTARDPGLRWANPFYQKSKVSTRVRNFESGQLKVNDSQGSPIEIAAVVVWKVVDTAEAMFEVDDYEEYVTIQSEAALRNLATSYPYEPGEDGGLGLRSDPQDIANALQSEIQDRLDKAGVQVIEARISHLAYAPEIAHAMLRRQQAAAVIAARQQIVAGAVGMVEMAIAQLERDAILELDDERKASMVSNLLVVLCGEESARPVVNAGTLYG